MKDKRDFVLMHVEPVIRFFSATKRRKKVITVLLFCMVTPLIFLNSCKGDEDSGSSGKPHDPNKKVVLTSFSPDSGRISEMVLLDGENFGTDPSKIKVYFNNSEAAVINSTGTRILALVPRLPGDTCTLKVIIGEKEYVYEDRFRYKMAASVTTLAGDGNSAAADATYSGGLDRLQLTPVYIGIDDEFNIFVSVAGSEPDKDVLLKLNVAENNAQVVATGAQGYDHRCPPIANPVTQVLQTGSEDERDRFCFMDPKAGWIPKLYFIKKWKETAYALPGDNRHYHCLYSDSTKMYYTRYHTGQLVRIDPATWIAEIIGMTQSGIAYGMAINPRKQHELWIAYDANAGNYSHSICTVDITDTETSGAFIKSFVKLSGATSGGYRNGIIEGAQFKSPRGISFDKDGNLYVGDNGNECIRMIRANDDPITVETMIGIPNDRGYKEGSTDEAQFNQPHGIVADKEGVVYVSDYGNKRVRRIAVE